MEDISQENSSLTSQNDNQPSETSEEIGLILGPWRLPLRAVATALVVWYLVSILVKGQAADLDLWGYLAFGRLFWETGRFPYQDVFTYLPTNPIWVYHEWLTGVLYYPLAKWLGGWVLQLLRLTLALATVGLLAATARRRGADFWGIVVLILAGSGFLASGYSPVRAQIFSYFFFALTLFLLEACRLTQKFGRLLWLIPLYAIWGNLHGGFLAGLGLIGLYGAGELVSRRCWWPYAAVLPAILLATLVNPYGWQYWTYLIQAVTMPRPEITEWASIIGAWQGKTYRFNVIYLGVVLFFAGCLIYLTRRLEFTATLALGVTLILGARHIRHLEFFYLLLGPYLAPLMTQYLERLGRRPGVVRLRDWLLTAKWQPLRWGAVLVGAILILQLALYPCWRLTVPERPAKENDPIYYPVAAVTWLKNQGLKGKLLTTFNWGEYLLWQLYPDFRVGLDGRYETVYPEAVHRPYMDFIFARPGWEKFLAAYPPDFILVERGAKIAELLEQDRGWQKIYEDEVCLILVPPTATPNLKTAGRY